MDLLLPFGVTAMIWCICVFAPSHQLTVLFGVAADLDCPPDMYSDAETEQCLPCSNCKEDQGIKHACNRTFNTVCENCTDDTYSDFTSSGRQCHNCKVCAPSKQEVTPCTPRENSICGACASGYFLYIDSEGSRCLKCSPCPDSIAIHWIECAEANLDEDHQCAPGEVNDTSTMTPQPTAGTEPPTMEASDTPITTDRGGFLPQSESKPFTTEKPSEAIGIAISTISLVFTLATVIVFVIAFGCVVVRLCRHSLCQKPRAPTTTALEESPQNDENTSQPESPLIPQDGDENPYQPEDQSQLEENTSGSHSPRQPLLREQFQPA